MGIPYRNVAKKVLLFVIFFLPSPATRAQTINSAGLGGTYGEAIWVSGSGFTTQCKVNIYHPTWQSLQPLATLSGSQVNCQKDLVTFAIPVSLRSQYLSLNVNVQNSVNSWSAPILVNISQLAFLGLTDSGYKYTRMTRMDENRIAGGYHEVGNPASILVWSWTSNATSATVAWSGPAEYQENFVKEKNWIRVKGWSALHEITKQRITYKVLTKKVHVYLGNRIVDLSEQFLDQPHPYALENIPASDYAIYVEFETEEWFPGNVKSSNPNGKMSWWVHWKAPHQAMSPYFGERLAIEQSEVFISYRFLDNRWTTQQTTQNQIICKDVGLVCLSYPSSATTPYATSLLWNW